MKNKRNLLRALRRVPVAPLAAALCAAGAGMAHAQSSPYYIGASQAFTHESNLFRSEDGTPETSDTYSTTGVLAGFDQQISRQRVFADAALKRNIFSDTSRLNNTAYRVNLGADLETVNRLSGRLNYTAERELATYGTTNAPQITDRNLQRTQQFVARGQWGLASLMTVEVGYTHRQLDYSATAYNPLEYRQNAVNAGVRYWPSDLLNFGVGVRHTDGEYPRFAPNGAGGFDADNFRRNDLDFTADWKASGLSTLRGRLSLSRVRHDLSTRRNVSGATGQISWDYVPTGKLRFTTTLGRDTGQEATFFNFADQISAVGDNSRLTNRARLQAFWDATAKIRANLDLRYAHRDIVSSINAAESGTDSTRRIALGLRYRPNRAWEVGCSVGHESRSASTTLSYDYSAAVAGCSVQLTLQ